VCVCVCVCVCVFNACDKIVRFHEQSFGTIICNVAGCIKPIRLRYIEDCLDDMPVRVSGWGRTSDS
jgi:hypothetical protein